MKKLVTGMVLFLVIFTCIAGGPVSMVHAQSGKVVVNEESGKAYKAGLELFRKKQYAKALDHFTQAYDLDKRNINALFAKGLSLNKLERDKEAAEVLENVLAIDPAHEKSLKLLPASYAAAGMTDKAMAAYDKGVQAYPDDFYFYHAKGVLCMKLGTFDKAAGLFRQALAKSPDRMEIREKLMFAFKEAGRMDDAYKVAREILAKDGSHARARVIAADHLRLSGDLEDALKEYERAAGNIETKAYAEHFIEVINQKLEEQEIEQEYQERMRKQNRNREQKGG